MVASAGEDAEPGQTVHVPVLPAEILQLGAPQIGDRWIDGTAGGGGHCRLLAESIGQAGTLLAIDRDPAAVRRLKLVLPGDCVVAHDSYDQIPRHMEALGWDAIQGVLLDLGLSSDQLQDRERGFSFQTDGDLDMRFDPSSGEPAWEWLQRVDEKTLADTIYRYGEERFSRRIARRIVERRRTDPVQTAAELRELIYQSIPHARRTKGGTRRHGRVDPATRTFQALRIAVNDELAILENALQRLPDCLAPGGALMILSFHSLEDRMVKYAFRDDPRLEIVTKKPVQASEQEVEENPRSRSAKLRVARRRPLEA